MTADAQTRPAVTARDMMRALWVQMAARYAVVAEAVAVDPAQVEVRHAIRAGERGAEYGPLVRRIDLLALRYARRPDIGPIERLAIEVKVARADLRADVADPAKQAVWRAVAHRHAYAVPEHLADLALQVVPPESGVLVGAYGHADRLATRWARRAPWTDTAPDLPARTLVPLLYRLAAVEARDRGWTVDGPEGDPEVLRAQVADLTARLAAEERRADQARSRADRYRRLYAAVAADGVPCADCGQPLRPARGRTRYDGEWVHADPAHDGPCRELRAERALADARAWWDALPAAEQARRLTDEFGPRTVEAWIWQRTRTPDPPGPVYEA